MPYFVYDIYAMFLCYWHKLQVKGHEVDNGPKSKSVALSSYLRREFLMVLHHVVMVTVCFPVSVVTVAMHVFVCVVFWKKKILGLIFDLDKSSIRSERSLGFSPHQKLFLSKHRITIVRFITFFKTT